MLIALVAGFILGYSAGVVEDPGLLISQPGPSIELVLQSLGAGGGG